jgi:hypothetical protein
MLVLEAKMKMADASARLKELEEERIVQDAIYLKYWKQHNEADRELAKVDGRSKRCAPYHGKQPPKRQMKVEELPKDELNAFIQQLEDLHKQMVA